MSTLILLDANNALYRYGFAHHTLMNSEGEATGAIYGMLGSLVRLKRRYPDGQFILVWDGPGKTWRHKYYPEYKGNRTKPEDKPEEVKRVLAQADRLRKVIDMLQIPQVEVNGVEADDLIAMLAFERKLFGGDVVVYSGDQDFMQLMAAGISVIRPKPWNEKKDALAPETKKSVKKRFGVGPEDVLKLRAYAGDKSDNIPTAVPGIGEKRAAACLKAGADPSQEKLVCTDLKLFGKLAGGWANVRRNYTLMQLSAVPNPELFGAAVVKQVRARTLIAGKLLTLNGKRIKPHEDYRKFLLALLELDLLEALENRHFLWQIQRVRAGRSMHEK